eukprot:XP_001692483.1 subunit of the ESCRT-I complex [Chlamydomonas reinhardtii]
MSNSVLDYLTSVLSQRGPTAVPYDEAVKWNVRDHVSELQVFPTLTAKLSEYHSNDGRLLNVLKVEGTMPIHYQGAKYNIPILMWLAERYPYNPPQVFVVPTANMIIRPSAFVNPSGQVATPLLRSWLFPSSNLVDVVLEMSQVFGNEPPLYTKPGYPNQHYPAVGGATGNLTPYATPSVGNTPNSTPGPAPGQRPGPGSMSGPAIPPPPPPPPPPAEPPRPSVDKAELEVHFRHLAIEALSGQLKSLARRFSDHAQEETAKAVETQSQLSERRARLQAAHDSLTAQRMGTEQLVSELAAKNKALQGWLDRNEPLAAAYDPETVPVSSLLLPADERCRQGMETQAQDLALEDAILALDRLLQTGQIALDAYLKQVRSLCRRQFFARALGLKVAAAEVEGPPAASGSSAVYQTRPFPIAHGDGWSHGAAPPPPPPPPPPAYAGAHTGVLTNPLAGR